MAASRGSHGNSIDRRSRRRASVELPHEDAVVVALSRDAARVRCRAQTRSRERVPSPSSSPSSPRLCPQDVEKIPGGSASALPVSTMWMDLPAAVDLHLHQCPLHRSRRAGSNDLGCSSEAGAAVGGGDSSISSTSSRSFVTPSARRGRQRVASTFFEVAQSRLSAVEDSISFGARIHRVPVK